MVSPPPIYCNFGENDYKSLDLSDLSVIILCPHSPHNSKLGRPWLWKTAAMHSANVSVCQGRKLIGIKENDDQIRMLCKPAHDACSAEMYCGTSPLCCIKDRTWSAMCGIKEHTEQTSSKVQSSDMKAIQPWDPHHLSIYISLQCDMLTTIHGLQKHWVCWILASKRATIPNWTLTPKLYYFLCARRLKDHWLVNVTHLTLGISLLKLVNMVHVCGFEPQKHGSARRHIWPVTTTMVYTGVKPC